MSGAYLRLPAASSVWQQGPSVRAAGAGLPPSFSRRTISRYQAYRSTLPGGKAYNLLATGGCDVRESRTHSSIFRTPAREKDDCLGAWQRWLAPSARAASTLIGTDTPPTSRPRTNAHRERGVDEGKQVRHPRKETGGRDQ